MHTRVLAQRPAGAGHDGAVCALLFHAALLKVGAHELGVVAIGHEADLLAVTLGGDGEVHRTGQLAHFRLGHFPQRKQRAGKLRLRQAK